MPRILVVDDSVTQRALARFILQDAGFEVLEAEDGSSALAMASREQLDCVLLDLNLPGESGQEVLQALRANGHSIPIVISSAGVDEETRRECLALGAAAVTDKPANPKELEKLIESVLGD